MNILLINHYAGTPSYGMEYRPFHIAKEWVKSGHKVLVVGGSYSHLRKQQPNPGAEIIDGVNFYWIKINAYNGNGIGRIVSMLLFVSKLWCFYKQYLNDFWPDVVIASSTYPIDIYPARKISKYYGAKLFYEVHDLWPLSPIELGGYSKGHPFIRIMQKAENYCYKYVDGVVSLLPKAEEHMWEHGLEKGKFFYVPNGIVIEDWANPKPLPDEHNLVLTQLKQEGKFIVGFAGAHGIANSLYSVIDAVAQLNSANVVLVLVGTGQEKNNLIKYVRDNKIENVFFLLPVNKLAIPSLLQKMDVLYIGLQKQSLFRFGISPNKMFDYMMSGKPIVQAIDAGNNLVEEASCGLYAEPENVESIKKAILAIKNMTVDEREKLGANGHAYVLKNHTYKVLSDNFIKAINTVHKR